MAVVPASGGDAEPHMNVRHLEIFWAVMRSGSQHEAARLLGLSQPAISKLLRYTEQRMGFPLFHRIRGRLHPTPEARVFFTAVDGIFGQMDATARLARDLRRRLTGRITVTTSSAFNQALLPQALAGFLDTHALMQIGVKVLTPAEAVERVVKGEADLGLTYGPLDMPAADMHSLRAVPIVCALPPGHALARKRALDLSDLSGERLITATERPLWGKLLGDAFADAGVHPEVAIECTQPDLGFALAAAGAGITVMPAVPVLPGCDAFGSIRPLVSPITVPLLAVTARDRAVPQAVAVLIEQLRQTAAVVPWTDRAEPYAAC